MADTTAVSQSIDQFILDAERAHKIINGTALETVIVEDGSQVPTVRKALVDNLYFKTPAMSWVVGAKATVFNQLYAYQDPVMGVQWWYAPGATATSPVTLPASPSSSTAWRLYVDSSVISRYYATLESPIFTGNPQAPTPPGNSNGTTIATTAFVVNAISEALTSTGAGGVTYGNLEVVNQATLNNASVSGDLVITGMVSSPDADAIFRNITLSSQVSNLSFAWIDTDNPDNLSTVLTPTQVQTHDLHSDTLSVGVVSANDTTVSVRAQGNALFDFLSIQGNTERPDTDPRLQVAGTTVLENLQITGAITGVTFGVDGQDIAPNSVSTTTGITVGSDLEVKGNGTIGGSLTVTGETILQGITTTGDVNINGTLNLSSLNLTQGLTVTDSDASITGNLSATGDVSLNGAEGTTTVNNLVIQGSVSGINFDLQGTDLLVNSVSTTGDATVSGDLFVAGTSTLATQDADTGVWSGEAVVNNLTVHGTITGYTPDLSTTDLQVSSLSTAGNISGAEISGASVTTDTTSTGTLSAERINVKVKSETVTGDYIPDGTRNMYYLTLSGDLNLGAMTVTEGDAFTVFIYVQQDDTGNRIVNFDPSYIVLNDAVVNAAPNSVTILQAVYCGVGSAVDLTVTPRP